MSSARAGKGGSAPRPPLEPDAESRPPEVAEPAPPEPGPPPLPARAVETMVAIAFGVAIAAAAALGLVYSAGGQPQAEGVLLAVALGGIGVGIVTWAKRFLPGEEEVEERHPLPSSEEARAAFSADIGRGGEEIGRRRLLVRLLAGAVATLGVAALFPVRSLGPRPGRGLFRTGFARGVRLVDDEGRPVLPADLPVDGVITVWPEGQVGRADSPALLIRVGRDLLARDERTAALAVDGVVAYSKLCTHNACPVGLYQAQEHLLLCPCHQSTFDVLDRARPVFGPATRALPQLPLALDGTGHLIAEGDFTAPVGAGFWDRGRR